MEHVLLIVAIILQVSLGSYVLFRNPRSRVSQLFAWCTLAYALSTFGGLLRLVVVKQIVAANTVVFSTIVVYFWTGTFIGMLIVAIFYPNQFVKYRFWVSYLPTGIALLVTIGVLVSYVNLPNRADIVSLIPGTDIYYPDPEAFPARGWSVGYISIWMLISSVLLGNVIIRRPGKERQSAVLLGLVILLPGVFGSLGSRVLTGSLRISVPTLSSALLSVAFGYVIIRYRLFSTEELAIELVLDNLHDGMLILRVDLVVLNCNQRAADLLGLPRQSILNRQIDAVLSDSAFPRAVWSNMWPTLQQSLVAIEEIQYTFDQSTRIVVNEAMPICDALEHVQGYVWMIRDVTALRQGEEQIEARNKELQEALSELQTTTQIQGRLLETIQVLSAPAVPVIQGIVVMPLSGQIDSERARRIMSSLLAGIQDHGAKIAIIDITGVPVVDTVVAQYLIQAARAASLMGCRPLLVGIRPEIAQVIVELGIDMGGLVTFSDLQSGVEYALQALGMKLVHTVAKRSRVAVE